MLYLQRENILLLSFMFDSLGNLTSNYEIQAGKDCSLSFLNKEQVPFKLYPYGKINLREITRKEKLLCGVFTPIIPAYCTKSLTLKKSDFFHLTDIFPFNNINRMGRIIFDLEGPHHGCFCHQYFTNNILHSLGFRIETFTIFTIRVSCFF